VVIEVSYSQKRRDLARLADDCTLGSDDSIRLVIVNSSILMTSTDFKRMKSEPPGAQWVDTVKDLRYIPLPCFGAVSTQSLNRMFFPQCLPGPPSTYMCNAFGRHGQCNKGLQRAQSQLMRWGIDYPPSNRLRRRFLFANALVQSMGLVTRWPGAT
jgi:hypothetical protein